MKLLILLAVVCVVAVSSLPVTPGCAPPPAPPPPPPPSYKAGSEFLHKDYAHGKSGSHGSHYHNQGGSSYFDKAESNQKTKQVIESESSSQRVKGGSSYGSASGGLHGAYSEHGHGSVTAGSQYQQVGY